MASSFNEGVMHMDGTQALAFVRERKQLSEGDISRGRRQLAVIKAIMLKGLSRRCSPTRSSSRTSPRRPPTTSRSTRTSTSATMRSEAVAMRNLRGSDIRFVTAPFSGFGTSPEGGSIDIVDQGRMSDLGKAIREDDLESYQ